MLNTTMCSMSLKRAVTPTRSTREDATATVISIKKWITHAVNGRGIHEFAFVNCGIWISLILLIELKNMLFTWIVTHWYFVREVQRITNLVNALKSSVVNSFCELMNALHVSLRDAYEVTGFQLDAMAEKVFEINIAVSSRMTGLPFGGCTVSLVKKEVVPDFIKSGFIFFGTAAWTTYKAIISSIEIDMIVFLIKKYKILSNFFILQPLLLKFLCEWNDLTA